MLSNKKAQTLIEYVTILIVVMGVFLAIGTYIKRGIQGRMKDATDELGDQYDPRVANSLIEYRQVVNAITKISTSNRVHGKVLETSTKREDASTIVETKKGFMAVGGY